MPAAASGEDQAKWVTPFQRQTPEEVKKSHPKASILRGSRVFFNIKGNDYRLVGLVHYGSGIVMIRFFGTHQEYDDTDGETVL